MPYMASFKSDLQNSIKIYRENRPRPTGAMFLRHHDGLNNLGRGSPKKFLITKNSSNKFSGF